MFPNNNILAVIVALVVSTVGVYVSVKDHGYIAFDDPGYVEENRHVRSGITWNNVNWAFTSREQSNWHPLTWISHMLDCQWYGADHPGMHHLTNVALHVVNSVILFLWLSSATNTFWRSVFVTFVFALHPLHVESVAWISERKDVLSTLFWFLCLASYLRYVRQGGRIWYVATNICLILGLMSKPMLVTVPFVLLLLDYWPLGRLQFFQQKSRPASAETQSSVRRRKKTKRTSASPSSSTPTSTSRSPDTSMIIIEKIPLFATIFLSSLVTYFVQKQGGAVGEISFYHRAATSAVGYVRYIGKTIWPTHLSLLYPNHPDLWQRWQIVAAMVILVAITFVAFLLHQRRYFIVGWFWYLGTLFPVIGLVQIGLHSMADRYMYVPMIGLLIMVAWSANDLTLRWPHIRPVLSVAAVSTVVVCIYLTPKQVALWRDSVTLFQHAVNVTDRNYVMHNNLGNLLQKENKLDEAMIQYRRALEAKPNFFKALNNLGDALRINKDYPRAIATLQRAIENKPESAIAYNNLGIALQEQNDIEGAISCYQKALDLDRHYLSALNNLGLAFYAQNQLDKAIKPLKEAIRIDSEYAEAHNSLAAVLQQLQRFDEAIDHCRTALRIRPNYSQAYGNWGIALVKQGKIKSAVDRFRQAVQLEPNDPIARRNLELAISKLHQEK